jgi:hypothetical protein
MVDNLTGQGPRHVQLADVLRFMAANVSIACSETFFRPLKVVQRHAKLLFRISKNSFDCFFSLRVKCFIQISIPQMVNFIQVNLPKVSMNHFGVVTTLGALL